MNKLLFTLLLILTGFSSSKVLATAQFGDLLMLDGKRVVIYSTPLEDLFKSRKSRPEFESLSSALWRGYIALWKIEKAKLYLVSIHKQGRGKDILGEKIPLSFVFPGEKKTSPVEATWFTGALRIPEGEELRYVHMGFGTIHERDRYIAIKAGKVTNTKVVDNKGKGATQSNADLSWVAMGDGSIKDKGDWVDARNLYLKPAIDILLADGLVKTRGVYFAKSDDDPAMLIIFQTPTTEAHRYGLKNIPKEPKIVNGSHVEIETKFDAENSHFLVEKIRSLRPGETMHHPDYTVPKKPEPKPIREFSIETIEKLGSELYFRGGLLFNASDLVSKKFPEIEKMNFAGTIADVAKEKSKVYFLRSSDEHGIKQGYVVAYDHKKEEFSVEAKLDDPVPEKIKLRNTAKQTAIEAIPGFYDRPYNFVVLDDPDGEGFLVYSIAGAKSEKEIVIGGHTRISVSPDGKKAEAVDALYNSLLILKSETSEDEEVVAAMMSHVVSNTPVETHVFQSILHDREFWVITNDAMQWKIKDGKISKEGKVQKDTEK